jgi:hypothetical protein
VRLPKKIDALIVAVAGLTENIEVLPPLVTTELKFLNIIGYSVLLLPMSVIVTIEALKDWMAHEADVTDIAFNT